MSVSFMIPEGENTLTCRTCGQKCNSTGNGECVPCWHISQAAWTKKMAIRQDPSRFDVRKLVNMLLTGVCIHE